MSMTAEEPFVNWRWRILRPPESLKNWALTTAAEATNRWEMPAGHPTSPSIR